MTFLTPSSCCQRKEKKAQTYCSLLRKERVRPTGGAEGDFPKNTPSARSTNSTVNCLVCTNSPRDPGKGCQHKEKMTNSDSLQLLLKSENSGIRGQRGRLPPPPRVSTKTSLGSLPSQATLEFTVTKSRRTQSRLQPHPSAVVCPKTPDLTPCWPSVCTPPFPCAAQNFPTGLPQPGQHAPHTS